MVLTLTAKFPNASVGLIKNANRLINEPHHTLKRTIQVNAIQAMIKEKGSHCENDFAVHIVLCVSVSCVADSDWADAFKSFEPRNCSFIKNSLTANAVHRLKFGTGFSRSDIMKVLNKFFHLFKLAELIKNVDDE